LSDAIMREKKMMIEKTETCCSCSGSQKSKSVLVEYLYLDLQTCDRCIGTDQVLDEVMSEITPVLALAGYEVDYQKIEMASEEVARQYGFLSSPTIRVNGRDICMTVSENSCGCCSDISGTDVDCRVFEFNGESFEVPPKEMLAEAVLQMIFQPAECACGGNEYRLPDNLKDFYEGKQKQQCSCGGSCC
ncbi:MAG: DUF2703 domain-containing protein, partial [Eubacteriales bacterium]|nr:DUF2703 domain-containing protein [Eubacteriales bacterium]